MIELFLEVTGQLFWEGYAEQLVAENPLRFTEELNEFLNNYTGYERNGFFDGQGSSPDPLQEYFRYSA